MRGSLLFLLRSALSLLCLFVTDRVTGLSFWSKKSFSLKITLCTQPHYTEILPGLYLGNARAACNPAVLQSLNITHVLTVEAHRLQHREDNITYLFIRAYDLPTTHLLPYFPIANAFIEEGIQKGAVLVHCHFGVSRSATLVIAYVMEKFDMSYDQAFEFVRSKRRFINPNSGFVDQLKLYESRHFQVGGFQRFEAFLKIAARRHSCKLACLAAGLLGVIVPLVVLLA